MLTPEEKTRLMHFTEALYQISDNGCTVAKEDINNRFSVTTPCDTNVEYALATAFSGLDSTEEGLATIATIIHKLAPYLTR